MRRALRTVGILLGDGWRLVREPLTDLGLVLAGMALLFTAVGGLVHLLLPGVFQSPMIVTGLVATALISAIIICVLWLFVTGYRFCTAVADAWWRAGR